MRMHQVEVDQEVFDFIKSRAEPLVDTFNSALRRELPLGGAAPFSKKRAVSGPNSPGGHGGDHEPLSASGLSQALRQIIWVATLVYGGSYSRTDATRYVANQLNIAPQTVLDKYCRQLELTAAQFDRLLVRDKIGDLKNLLHTRFPDYVNEINRAFARI